MSAIDALALGWEARTWEPQSSVATMSRAAAARKGTAYQAAVPAHDRHDAFHHRRRRGRCCRGCPCRGDALRRGAVDDVRRRGGVRAVGVGAAAHGVLVVLADREHHRGGPSARPRRDRLGQARFERRARRGQRRGHAAGRHGSGPYDAGIHPRHPRRAHARPAVGRPGGLPFGAGVDRRVRRIPARSTVRPAAPRADPGRHRGPVCVHRSHRPAAHRARRRCSRAVRDDPPLRRRQRPNRACPGSRAC